MSEEAAATETATLPPMDLPTLRRFIAPLSKEQLIELLATAALDIPEVYTKAHEAVRASPGSRRLMVRNVAFSTTDADFLTLFKQFGEIDDATVVRDKDQRSRGYGFVTFKELDAVRRALNAVLTLDGRQLLSKLAADPFADFSSGNQQAGQGNNTQGSRRKLFVRNLNDTTDSESLRQVFSVYGELEECAVVTDQAGKSRGYGFITYVSPEAAIKAVQQPQRVINNRVAFIAFATPAKFKGVQGGGQNIRRGPRMDNPMQIPMAYPSRDQYGYRIYSQPQFYPQYPQYFSPGIPLGPQHISH